MARRTLTAVRVWEGSGILARRIRRRITAWIAAGRRPDLTGWQAALGCIVRAALVLLAGYLLARILRALPALLWLLAPVWLVIAYRAAPPATTEEELPAGAAEPPADPRADLARWLLQTIGGRPGIHLYELYPAMRKLPGLESLDDTALRAALRTLGVTVTRSLRVPPVEGRSGVRREDAEALLSPGGEGPVQTAGDAGQSGDSPVLSASGEWVKSA